MIARKFRNVYLKLLISICNLISEFLINFGENKMNQIHKPISKKKKVAKEISKVAAGILIPVVSKIAGVDIVKPLSDLFKVLF